MSHDQRIIADYAAPPTRPPRPGRWAFIVVAAIHFALQVTCFFISFSRGMARFDSAAPPAPSERLLDAIVAVLFFPIVSGLPRLGIHVPGLAGWLVFLANSMLWGLAAAALARLWMWRRRRAVAQA